jgi:hypothetical protein
MGPLAAALRVQVAKVMLAEVGMVALLTLTYRPVAVAVEQEVRVQAVLVTAATAAQVLTPL